MFESKRVSDLLRSFEFTDLFIEELGWDRPKSRQPERILVEEEEIGLLPIAEKRGVRIFICDSLLERSQRQRIEKEIAKRAFEHLIIFTDHKKVQIWQWVAREKGKPDAYREHRWTIDKAPDLLIQKIQHIAFTLDEEEQLTLSGTTKRLQDAFDREKLTKKFYEAFKKQHEQFLGFIEGLENVSDRQWYASLMLNRLMFVYFIQKKRFLDGNPNYLRDRLALVQERQGENRFHSFYRAFLLKLFHGGLAAPKNSRDDDISELLGDIPYLNGGLFEPHALEAPGHSIEIADQAFEAVFRFFDQYEWTLDTRAIENVDGKEINPDVLGHIFEKYINQKQMGAYYTKEDITDYIARNCILPWLFRYAEVQDRVAFEDSSSLWTMIAHNPDRYIFDALKKGLALKVPEHIAPDPDSVEPAQQLRCLAPQEYGLPNETWQDFIARRERYYSLRSRLERGEIRSIGSFLTENLDIRQFALDAIQFAEGPDRVRAFWKGLSNVKILDPACGSGAFLFASLNILHELYRACLDRMEQFVSEKPSATGLGFCSDFEVILQNIDKHKNQNYFIYKSIIIDNLYGVDIMDEAVEICKLRLFLKLAAQLDSVDQIEPLPDIDFNIRAGNSILGFKTVADAVEKSRDAGLQFDDKLTALENQAHALDESLSAFRAQQTLGPVDGENIKKSEVRENIALLKTLLNDVFFDLYAPKGPSEQKSCAQRQRWIENQKLFHWVIDFHDIMENGGFSVIVGNPPYVEIDKGNSREALLDEYETCLEKWSRDEDLYTLFVERSLRLVDEENGSVGLILPLSVSFSTKRPFIALREVVSTSNGNWHWSHYDRIPSSLFGNDVRTRCSIGIWTSRQDSERKLYTTAFLRWGADRRPTLFDELEYGEFQGDISDRIPKVANDRQSSGLGALLKLKRPLGLRLGRSISANSLIDCAPDFPDRTVFVAGTAYNWFPAWRTIPETTDDRGRPGVPARAIGFQYEDEDEANVVFALLCSSLGYWWWAVASDGFNLKKWLIEAFPLSPAALPPEQFSNLSKLGNDLKSCLESNYVFKDNKGRKGNFYLPACSSIVAQIDQELVSGLSIITPDFMADIQSFNQRFSQVSQGDTTI